ncbi:MAG TPA: fasciclin domain-containing protein [Gemmatimonadales bacterium]|nr:fasciclin domain-containing protein [Gemmatimonadales bacterium]
MRTAILLVLSLAAPPLAAQQADIVGTARRAGSFTTLLAAAEAAGLTQALLGEGPYTVFAPTDEAFAALPNGTIAQLLAPSGREQLRQILSYHVVAGRVTAQQARSAGSATTLAGAPVVITDRPDGLRINDASVQQADIRARNGIIHVIDRVLLPPATAARAAAPVASRRATHH